jgi:MYXO-CTERM domain-containing protein
MDTSLICPNNCGTSCTAGEPFPVTKARVKLPIALDGFPRRSGILWLTDDEPYDIHAPSPTSVLLGQSVDLDDPSVTEIRITVPEEETPYKPCFTFVAEDARGDQASVEPLCLEHSIAAENAAGAGSGGPTPSDAPLLGAHPAESSNTSAGCSLASVGATGGAWPAVLGLLALVRRRWTGSARS